MRHQHSVSVAAALLLSACGGTEPASAPKRAPEAPAQEARNGDLLFGRGSYTSRYDPSWRLLAARHGGGRIDRVSPLVFVDPPSPSPDGKRLAFSKPTRAGGPPRQVYVAPLRGRSARRLTSGRWADWPAGWSPDGRRLLVGHAAGIGHTNVSVVNVVGRGRRLLRAEGWVVENAWWSPDGRMLLAVIGTFGRPGHYLIDARTWESSRITGNDERAWSVSLAPGGRLALVTIRYRPITYDLWLADEDGSNRELVVSTQGQFWGFQWSPDGSRLALSVLFGDDDTSRLVVLPATARLQRISESSGVPGRHAVWSPDGTRLAFVRGRFPTDDIWVRTADGTVERRLTRSRAAERPLAWLPAERG